MLYTIDQIPYSLGFVLFSGLLLLVSLAPVAIHFSRQARLGYEVLADIEWRVEEATAQFQLHNCVNDLTRAERYLLNSTMHAERNRIEALIIEKQNRLELAWP